MAPDWEELGEYMSKQVMPGVDLTIAEVNCVENSVLCLKQGVDSYPSIKLYKPGLFSILKYLQISNFMDRWLCIWVHVRQICCQDEEIHGRHFVRFEFLKI